MKFIFPQNYNFNNKLFGVIDYETAILNIIWISIIIFLSNIIFDSLMIKICVCIILGFPLILLSFIGLNGEKIIDVFSYMFRFIIKQKLLFFNK